MQELKDRVALVTGASRGIGMGIALALAEAGATVAVNYRERGDEAGAVIETLRKRGRSGAAFRADVSMGTAVRIMVRDIEAQLGPIDILVNNAGIAVARGLEEGLIDTEMGKPLLESGVAAGIPVGRPGTPEDIAWAVQLIVSNAYMTGQTIAVNGGTLFS